MTPRQDEFERFGSAGPRNKAPRKNGNVLGDQEHSDVLPQDIDPKITDPLVEKIAGLPEEQFLTVDPLVDYPFPTKKGVFDARRCESCGEMTFVGKLRMTPDGKLVCIPCSGYAE